MSNNPADVLVAAFCALEPEVAVKLRGKFAAVVTDGRRMWCIREHLGFRPLFYRDEPKVFLAATEIKQVVAGADVRREPDLDVLQPIFSGTMAEDIPSAFRYQSASKGIDGVGRAQRHAALRLLASTG